MTTNTDTLRPLATTYAVVTDLGVLDVVRTVPHKDMPYALIRAVLDDLCRNRTGAQWRDAIARDGVHAVVARTLRDAIAAGDLLETPKDVYRASVAYAETHGACMVVEISPESVATYFVRRGWDHAVS